MPWVCFLRTPGKGRWRKERETCGSFMAYRPSLLVFDFVYVTVSNVLHETV